MRTGVRGTLLAVLLGASSLADEVRAESPSAPGARGPATAGVWRKHEVLFSQLGFSSTYSCNGLAAKLTTLLRASGAHLRVLAVPIGCGDPGRPNAFAQVRLTFFTLTPAGARATQPGTWRRVTLTSRSPRELEIGDCELVARFRDELLPLFVTRTIVERTRCVPYQRSGSAIDLRFEVFARPSSATENRPSR